LFCVRVFDCYINILDLFCILLVLLFNFVMYCIVSTIVAALEINIYLSIYLVWDGLEELPLVRSEGINPLISPVLSVERTLDLLVGTI